MNRIKYLGSLLTVLLLAGCAVGPDYSEPKVNTPLGFSQPTPTSSMGAGHWAELYNDENLTDLVRAARENNHNLAALYQRTLQARAITDRARSETRPQLNTGATYRSFENSEQASDGRRDDLYSGGIDLSWELDLFGRVKRLVESAEAEAAQVEATYDQLLLVTETETAVAYFRIRALDREIYALERALETRRESLEIIRNRFENGAGSDLDVAQAETLFAESQAELAVLQRQRDGFEHALAVLTGEPAPDFTVETFALDGSPVVAPVGLPSDLLQRRPDLRQAEQSLIAANARVGVATANFYPRITIGGAAGLAANNADHWFESTAGFFNIGPSVSLPIFQGGRLRSELSRTEAQYAENLELYRQAILEAFAEVEDALSGWRHLSVQRKARKRAAASAARAQSLSEQQYRAGLINFITALDSERVALDAERRLAQVIGDEYVNSVRLIRSVGGSWK